MEHPPLLEYARKYIIYNERSGHQLPRGPHQTDSSGDDGFVSKRLLLPVAVSV